MVAKAELLELVANNLFNEAKHYLDELHSFPWDLNLGVALWVYESSNFGIVTNSASKMESQTDQFLRSWSRYRHCSETADLIEMAYDEYLEDEEGEEFDFSGTIYEAMGQTLWHLKRSYDLDADIFAANFFWAVKFADPDAAQAEMETRVFRDLNSAALFSQYQNTVS